MTRDWTEYRPVKGKAGYFVNMLGGVILRRDGVDLVQRVYSSTRKTGRDYKNNRAGINPFVEMRVAFPEFFGVVSVENEDVFRRHKLFPWLLVKPSGQVMFCHPVTKEQRVLMHKEDHNAHFVVDVPAFSTMPNMVLSVAELVMHVCSNNYRRHARMIHVDGDKSNCHISNLRTELPLVDIDYVGALPAHLR